MSERSKALAGAAVYTTPDLEPLRDATIVTRGNTIAAVGRRGEIDVPEDCEAIDCAGLTVTAGFWNSHVHFFERKWSGADAVPASELREMLEDFTRYGFTSVFDLSSSWDNTRRIRDRIESGEVPGPAIRSTGEGLVPPGAVPSDAVLSVMGVAKAGLPEIGSVAQAVSAATDLLDRGVDGLKMFLSSRRGERLSENVVAKVAQIAKRAGKPSFVHPNDEGDVLTALRAGIDVIAHTTPGSGAWNDEVLALAKSNGAALTPTLELWRYFLRHDRPSARQFITETAAAQLRAWKDAGGQVLFGTDFGAVDCDPMPEYVAMSNAGLDYREILASMTTAPAQRFGASAKHGRVAPGYAADLAVLEGDPSNGVRAFGAIRYTLRGGAIVFAKNGRG